MQCWPPLEPTQGDKPQENIQNRPIHFGLIWSPLAGVFGQFSDSFYLNGRQERRGILHDEQSAVQVNEK